MGARKNKKKGCGTSDKNFRRNTTFAVELATGNRSQAKMKVDK